MLRKHLEHLSVFVETTHGTYPNFDELNEAKKAILSRMFTAKELCKLERIGKCAVTWNHDIVRPEDLRRGHKINTVDVYSLDCHEKCPLGINDITSANDRIEGDD
jgi:hypothetical protein